MTITLSGFAILLGAAAVRVSSRTFDAAIVGWTFAYGLAVIVAIMEKYFGFVPQNSFLVLRGYALESVGLSSLFGNPNAFALFLLASSVVFMPYAVSARRPIVRVLYYALQLSTLYFMIESGSRTGLTCLLVVMVITLWHLLHKRDLARMLLILVVIALVAVQALTASGTAFFNDLRENSLFTSDDGSFLLRFNLVRNGLLFASESPLIGIGPDQYEAHMLTRQDLYPTSFIINPHNGFVEMLSQYGIVVFLLFVLFLLQTAVSAWKLMRSASSKRDKAYMVGQAQLLLIVLLPFASTMHSTFLGAPGAWLYLFALIALGRMAPVGEAATQSPELLRSTSGSVSVPAQGRHV
ncbi:O-antigen ligase family protein [Microbacterium sp. NPDC055988]|uniref:O-antigen ligase family protein n=1 Tax=Microbacterium sp. NPDC055988 TaxID=3345671 RepID=UPI0035D7B4A9